MGFLHLTLPESLGAPVYKVPVLRDKEARLRAREKC